VWASLGAVIRGTNEIIRGYQWKAETLVENSKSKRGLITESLRDGDHMRYVTRNRNIGDTDPDPRSG
jgi:hypothetical protein